MKNTSVNRELLVIHLDHHIGERLFFPECIKSPKYIIRVHITLEHELLNTGVLLPFVNLWWGLKRKPEMSLLERRRRGRHSGLNMVVVMVVVLRPWPPGDGNRIHCPTVVSLVASHYQHTATLPILLKLLPSGKWILKS